MTLLDEWNEQISGVTHDMKHLGFSSAEGEQPLFSLDHRAEYLSQGRGHAVAFAVSNDCIFIATSRNFLLRHDTAGIVTEFEFSKSPESRIRRVFVDPLGVHTIVIVQTGTTLETFYLDHSWKKARPIQKLRNLIITSIAWPPYLASTHPTDILLGTDKGVLYALHIEDAKRESLVQLYALHAAEGPIAGLAYLSLDTQSSQSGLSPPQTPRRSTKRLVMVLCGTHLHLFRGKNTLELIFSEYDTSSLPYKEPKTFDLPIEQGAAQLQLLFPPKLPDIGRNTSNTSSPLLAFEMPTPSEFAILSTSGVYYGRLDISAGVEDELDHLVGHKLLPLMLLQSSNAPVERPMSLALTQYHLILLYPSRIQFVNKLTKRAAQEIPLEKFAGPLRGAAALPLGLCRDLLAGRVFVLAGDDAYEVDASDEDRDFWKILLERGEYHSALLHCRSASQRNTVYLAEADALFSEGDVMGAAQIYGKVTSVTPSFEDLALKLMEKGDPDALLSFLFARLGTLGREDRAQSTMVATWLVELLLDKANRAALRKGESAEAEREREAADKHVQKFLIEKEALLDPGTTISLLEGYGRSDDLLVYAKARGDHEATLELLVQKGQAERALDVLRKPSTSPELAYKYAPMLVALAPAQTIQSWIDSSTPLEPRRLLPALMPLAESSAPRAARAEVLRYIEHCVTRTGSSDPALHDFAVAVLMVDGENEDALLEHLKTARDALGRPLYDAVHALRLSRECRRDRATVALLSEVGLWEDAVQLALEIDKEVAENIARRAHGNDELARKLWLSIVQHVIGQGLSENEEEKKDQVREVSRILDESRGAVKIEDVLPLFPDFVEMGAFRDAICASLEEYNKEMEMLRSEMTLATQTAAALRESLDKMESQTGAVDMEALCARCNRALNLQPPAVAGANGGALPRIFLFPTGNAFHGSCLCAETAELAPKLQRERILSLAKRLSALPETATMAPAEGKEPAMPVIELRKQLEDEIAAEDPYCGEIVVRHITKPFILPEEADIAASWAL